MVLCFAAVSRAALVAHQCFVCCWAALAQLEGFQSSILPPPPKAKKLGGDTAGTADQQTKGMSCTIRHRAQQQKLRGKWRMQGHCGYGVCLLLHTLGPCFPSYGWTSVCWWEAGNEFLLLLCFCAQLFLFFIKLCLSQPMSFSILFSPLVLWRNGRERGQLGGRLAASQGQPTRRFRTKINFLGCFSPFRLLLIIKKTDDVNFKGTHMRILDLIHYCQPQTFNSQWSWLKRKETLGV